MYHMPRLDHNVYHNLFYLIESFYLILEKKQHKTLEEKEVAFRLEQKKKQGCVVAYGDCIQVYNNHNYDKTI